MLGRKRHHKSDDPTRSRCRVRLSRTFQRISAACAVSGNTLRQPLPAFAISSEVRKTFGLAASAATLAVLAACSSGGRDFIYAGSVDGQAILVPVTPPANHIAEYETPALIDCGSAFAKGSPSHFFWTEAISRPGRNYDGQIEVDLIENPALVRQHGGQISIFDVVNEYTRSELYCWSQLDYIAQFIGAGDAALSGNLERAERLMSMAAEPAIVNYRSRNDNDCVSNSACNPYTDGFPSARFELYLMQRSTRPESALSNLESAARHGHARAWSLFTGRFLPEAQPQ